jgi:hypothetical protein
MTSTASPVIAERTARVRRIRARVAAGAVAVFVAVFGFLFGQLSSGNDPALASSSTTSTTTSSATDQSASNDNSAVQSQPAQTYSSPSPAPVTTSQS